MANDPAYVQTVKVSRYEIYDAQRAAERHRTEHRCRAGEGCLEYIRLINVKNDLAVHWNEPLDQPAKPARYL